MPFLYPHQEYALSRIQNGNIVNGRVGSGKSRVALAYYYTKLNNGYIDDNGYHHVKTKIPLFIITTAKKRDDKDWELEANAFGIDAVNDESFKVDSWNNIRKYTDIQNAFFIFDEQRVVGKGAWVKSFLKICKNNQWILLSATPGDTWTDYIPVFIANGFFKNRTEFNFEHVVYKPHMNFPVVDRYINTGRLIRLRRRILVDMEDTRETVPHHETITTSYNVSKYKEVIRTRWNPFKDKPIENASEYCQCLRRIVNVSEDKQIKILELFDKHPKMIVFYNYDYELEILKMLGWGKDVVVAEWNGHKHQPVPTEHSKWVYLVQYNAGSEGWNCIETDTIVFYSESYSFKMMEQASGRINRMNTAFIDLYYYHLKSKASIDLAIERALRKKKNFNEGKFYN